MRAAGEGTVFRNSKAKAGSQSAWKGELRSKGIYVNGPTKTETRKRLDAAIEASKTSTVKGRQKTVGDVFDWWLTSGIKSYKRGGKPISDGTRANHEWAIARLRSVELETGKRLVDIKAPELKPSQVSEALEVICRHRLPKSKAATVKPSGRPRKVDVSTADFLGEEALKRIKSVFSLALAAGIRRDWLQTNPATFADIPADAKPKGRRGYIQAEPANRLREALAEHPNGGVLLVMLVAGLRPGEAYALADDSLEGNLLHVTRSVRDVSTPNTTGKGPKNWTSREIVDELKTEGSRRSIDLTGLEVPDVLKAHLKREAPRIKAAKARKEIPLMFGTADNRPLDEKAVNALLKTLCESLGVLATHDDGIDRLPTAYELRHSMITILADHPDSTIEEVSELAGNKNERMVRDRYWHKDHRPPKTAAARLDWRK